MKLSTYEDWKNCITVICGVPLTTAYIEDRIAELKDPNNAHTRKFVSLWGEAHLQRTIGWFEKARQEFQ